MPFIQIGRLTHYYSIEGKERAPSLVFSNSLGSDLRIWDPVLSHLRDKFRIIRYDMRGHGLSDIGASRYTVGDLAGDLAGLLEGLEVDNAVVCGLSVGGMIAQSLAASHPQLVRAAILCSTAMQIGPPAMWDERIAVIEKKGIGALTGPIMERWFTKAFRDRRLTELRGYINMLERTPVEGYIRTCCAIRDADLRQSAASMRQPALVMCGDQDLATPPQSGKELADTIGGAKLSLVKDSAHIVCVEQPESFSRLVINFFEEISNG